MWCRSGRCEGVKNVSHLECQGKKVTVSVDRRVVVRFPKLDQLSTRGLARNGERIEGVTRGLAALAVCCEIRCKRPIKLAREHATAVLNGVDGVAVHG